MISAPSNFNHITHMGPGDGIQIQRLMDLPTTLETADQVRLDWPWPCSDMTLSRYRRLVTAAPARVLWPGRSRSRESSPCLVRAPASCLRPACPPIPRLLSGLSATQRSVAWCNGVWTQNDAQHLLCQLPSVKSDMRAVLQPYYGRIKWLVSSVSGLQGSANVRVQCVRLQPQPGLPGSVLQSPGEAGGWPLEARAGMIMTTASPKCDVKICSVKTLKIFVELMQHFTLWTIVWCFEVVDHYKVKLSAFVFAWV